MKPDAVAVEKELKACATQPISVKSKKKMEDKKFLIMWKTKIDDNYIDERQIVCKSKTSAKILYNRLAKLDKTVSIEMECLTNE